MTTAEFKEKYPHLAHLEGDALWNAMEDSMLTGLEKKPHRTLEDVMQDKRDHPEDWITEKHGDITFHWPRKFVEEFEDLKPKSDQPLSSAMFIPYPLGEIGLSTPVPVVEFWKPMRRIGDKRDLHPETFEKLDTE